MTLKAYADNVIIVLEPLPARSSGGIHLVHGGPKAQAGRWATVLASGPGYWKRAYKCPDCGHDKSIFVENHVKPGDRVFIHELAGQDFALDISAPRHNKDQVFQELCGDRGEFRIVRESEILFVEDVEEPVQDTG